MQALIIYILKANVILALLYGAYWLLLRNEKFFVLNRFILLACIALSFCFPLLPGTVLFAGLHNKIAVVPLNIVEPQPAVNNTVIVTNNITAKQGVMGTTGGKPSYLQLAAGLYFFIAFILLLRFARQIFTVRKLLKQNETNIAGGITYQYHNRELPPFSFFRHLVINRSHYGDEEYQQVVLHEQVHIKQLHTIDLLLGELTCIILWLNPLVYKLKSSIKLNLEFIADEQVLQTGMDGKSYQLNILSSCLNGSDYQLTTFFTSSKIKIRIKMMNTNKTPLRNLYKYAFALPVVLAAYFITSPVKAQPVAKVSAIAAEQKNSALPFDKLYVVINSHTNASTLESIKNNLADQGVEFNTKDITFKNGLLTNIGIEVIVPDVFKGDVTGKLNSLLTYPAIFYYERETGFHVIIGPVPDDISSYGRKIITNNLNGLLVVRNGSTELHGSCTW